MEIAAGRAGKHHGCFPGYNHKGKTSMKKYKNTVSLDLNRIIFLSGRVALLFLSAAIILSAGCSRQEQSKPNPAVPVKTATVFQQDVPVEVSANGTVEAFSVVNITSRVDGQVMKIHLQEGQIVEKGQVLVSIDDRPYQAMQAAAEASLAQDRIRLEKAVKDAARYADLVKKDYVTKAQYEQVLADAEALKAMVNGDEAALQNARLNVDYCRILSPITGRAGSILIHEGNLVKANDTKPLMVIHQVEPVLVRFTVPERRLAEIQDLMSRQELKVMATVPGIQNKIREGRLTFMDNTIDPNTGTITLKAEFDNQESHLWPGQFVNVILMLGIRTKAVVVPSEAIQMGQQGSYVFVVKKDLTVESRPVTPGARANHHTIIEKGLAVDETVVTDGHLKLAPGVKVVLKNEKNSGGDSPS
jgi:membrane fusion protein, multidrug efflux system